VTPGLMLAGLVVGILIGLTGMGGGSLTTPFLIIIAGLRPVVAVGTDLAYSAVTKLVGGLAHARQGSVDLRVVRRLAVGSIPGSLLGVWVLHQLGERGDLADELVTRLLGVMLMLTAASLLFGKQMRGSTKPRSPVLERNKGPLTSALGLLVGFLLGLTSVGSGTLIMAVLLLVTRKRPGSQLVGIDVVHGAVLVSAAALAHWGIGTVDWEVAGSLVIGSVPGVLIGSRLALRVPERTLRPALALVLLIAGIRLL